MDRKVQVVAGALAAVVVLLLLGWLFMPTTPPAGQPIAGTPDGRTVEPRPGAPRVTRPGQPDPMEAPDPAAVAMTEEGFVALADQPGSLEADPMGPRPINKQGIEASVEEMWGDIAECRSGSLPGSPGRIAITLDIAREIPPPDYGAEGTHGMVKSAQVSGVDGDATAFQDCVVRSLRPILFIAPASETVRVEWELDFDKQR